MGCPKEVLTFFFLNPISLRRRKERTNLFFDVVFMYIHYPLPDIQNKLASCIPKVDADTEKAFRDGSDFPLEVFPPFLQALVIELRRTILYPIDYTAASIITAISTCVGNTMRVQVMPNYEEYLVFYMALTGNPGSCKSHPMECIFKPIEEVNRKWSQEFNERLDAYEREVSQMKKGDPHPERPVGRQIIIGDITTEALVEVVRENPHGLCLKMDELTGWVRGFDQYKGGKGSEEALWLSFYSHKGISKNRVTDRHKTIVKDPFVNVIGTIQLGVLKNELLSGDKGSNGFFPRILFALPKNLDKPYRQKQRESSKLLPVWEALITAFAQMPYDPDDVKTLVLTDEADTRAIEYSNQLVTLCNAQRNNLLKDVYSKMDIAFYRLMGVLHVAQCLCCEGRIGLIDIMTVEKAITLTEYFRHSSERVLGRIFLDGLTAEARTLYAELPFHFSYGSGLSVMTELVKDKVITMSESSFKRFLKEHDNTLFRKNRHGEYEKLL